MTAKELAKHINNQMKSTTAHTPYFININGVSVFFTSVEVYEINEDETHLEFFMNDWLTARIKSNVLIDIGDIF